jgi:hypothetical protein
LLARSARNPDRSRRQGLRRHDFPACAPLCDHGHLVHPEETAMSKRARKRRARKGKGANHGRRPNA